MTKPIQAGNLQRNIDHEEKRQVERRNILAMYPDADETRDGYSAASAAKDAKDIGVAWDDGGSRLRIFAYARVIPSDRRIARGTELPVHVAAGSLDISVALQRFRESHPDAYTKLLAVVIEHGNGELPF